MSEDKTTVPIWLGVLISCGLIFLIGGWFPFAFAIVYTVTMFDIFAEHAPLVLKCSVAICFFAPFLLRMLLPEDAKNMLYLLIPVAFMMAQAYSMQMDMAAVQDAVFINNIFQPLLCNVLPVIAGLFLGRFAKNVIEALRKDSEVLAMKLRFDKRTVVLYLAVLLAFLAIQFIEPYPKGTADYETYDFLQWIVFPPAAAFIMTIAFCAAAKGEAEDKLPIILWIILSAVFAYMVSDFSFGIGYSFGFALVLCGIPTGAAFLLYIVGRALFEMLDENSEETMKKWEENNTGGF